jgi:hypothetical protein
MKCMKTNIEKEIDHNVFSAVHDLISKSCYSTLSDKIHGKLYCLTSFAITHHVRDTVGNIVRINIDNQIHEKRFS